MEMNKGEAEKCRDIGKKYLRAGNFRQAIKFLEKSLRMYPLPGVDAMIDRAKDELKKENKTTSPSQPPAAAASEGIRRRERAQSEEPSRPYTAEQLQMVRKIKACKTHYEVLSVSQSADDNEIKKAYRKLALKLHPDKNSAPGAEDAFKAVGKAFNILSDADKRAHYDRYGDVDESTTAASSRGHGRNRHYHEEEVSPEEIFNMFFGGGMRQTAFRGQRYAQRAGTAQRQQNPQGLIQFLPLLLIFLLSMFSIPSAPETPFSMEPRGQYNVLRTTKMANVIKGIPYYVDREFERKYTGHWRDLARVEQMVEQYHVGRLSESCDNLKLQQKRAIYRARNSNSDEREVKIRAALEMKMPACEELKALRRNRSY